MSLAMSLEKSQGMTPALSLLMSLAISLSKRPPKGLAKMIAIRLKGSELSWQLVWLKTSK